MKHRWPTVPLGEVASVIRGVSFDKSEATDFPREGSMPILRAGNIAGGLDLEHDLIWVSEARVSQEQRLCKGDVVIAMSSGSRDVVGKTAQLQHPWYGSVGAFCAIIRFSPKLNARFGAFWLQSAQFSRWRFAQSQGANIQNLRKSDLESVPIPLPPLSEQERIVGILDEAEGLRQRRAEADRRTAELLPALFHHMFGDPATNPKRWPVVTLGEIGGPGQYGLNAAAAPEQEGVRFVRITDIDDRGQLREAEAAYVPSDLPDLAKYELHEGDILIARSGATAGKSYLHAGLPFRAVFAGYLIRFRIEESKALPAYVAAFLRTKEYWRQLYSFKRAVAQPNVNAKQLSSLRIPLPPLSLQREFAERVGEVRELERRQAESRRRLDALFAALLDRAFNGAL